MKKIGNTIVEEGIIVNDKLKERITVRAVIFKDSKVLMLYSDTFDDYIFPGGGIKYNETHIDALKREVYEELGVKKIEIVHELGYTEEIRYGINNSNSTYNQKSFYYICKIDSIGKPNFVGREKEDSLTPKWENIDKIIKHNKKILLDETHQQKGFKTVLIRENKVLKYLKEVYFKKNL